MDDANTVVWRRAFDPQARARRRRKFLLWYGLPTLAAMAVGLVLGGTGALLGIGILLGGIGLLLLCWVELIGFNERMNPEIRIEDGALVLGRRSVRIDEVEAWSTVMSKQTTTVGAPNYRTNRFELAKVLFRLPVVQDGQRVTRGDGGPAFEIVAFAWPAMSADALDGVRVALEPHLEAPYVPAEGIRDL